MLNSVIPIMYNWPMSNKFRFSEAVLILFLSFKICFLNICFVNTQKIHKTSNIKELFVHSILEVLQIHLLFY